LLLTINILIKNDNDDNISSIITIVYNDDDAYNDDSVYNCK